MTIITQTQQYQQTDSLTCHGGPCCSCHAHIHDEDKERIEQDVNYCSRHDAPHSIAGIALKAHLIIKTQGTCDHRSTKQDDPQVSASVRQDGGGASNPRRNVVGKQFANNAYTYSRKYSIEEACRRHVSCLRLITGSELARDVRSGTIAEEEGNRLNEKHHRED